MEWEYEKIKPCKVCGDPQYSHAPDDHFAYAGKAISTAIINPQDDE